MTRLSQSPAPVSGGGDDATVDLLPPEGEYPVSRRNRKLVRLRTGDVALRALSAEQKISRLSLHGQSGRDTMLVVV